MRGIVIMFFLIVGFIDADWDVSIANGYQLFPKVVSDGAGGVFVGFLDMRQRGGGPETSHGYEVYFQHLDENGNRWSQDVMVSEPKGGEKHGHRLNHVICEGEEGKVIVCWINYHDLSGFSGDPKGIYCQKVNISGNLCWDRDDNVGNGIQPIKIVENILFPPSICSDGDGGCVVVVREKRYNAGLKKNEYRIRAWRILSDGTFADDPYYPGWNGKTGIDVVSWTTEVLGDPKAIQKFDFLGNKYKILSDRRSL